MVLEAIRYTSGDLQILDQLQLPYIEVFEPIHNAAQAWHAIRDMRVRGAPAIAIVAALGLAVQLSRSSKKFERASLAKTTIEDNLNYLVTSRPTAVNLADAVGKLKAIVLKESKRDEATGTSIKAVYIKAAESMLKDDIEDNKAIGNLGAAWIVAQSELTDRKGVDKSENKLSVLTHCNTGSLATAGYGTALGIVRSLHESTHLLRAYCTETRPYNQGARLTAYELVHDKIPATLITDSMAASLLSSRKDSDRLVAVVVGADRVAANGDTANKIGTLGLAVIARQYGVKFVVAAPRTTIDRTTKQGADIVVEERAASEVTCIKGQVLGEQRVETIETAAKGIDVWNPAFDITPAELIDAVVTEVGVVEKVKGQSFQFDDIFKKARTSS